MLLDDDTALIEFLKLARTPDYIGDEARQFLETFLPPELDILATHTLMAIDTINDPEISSQLMDAWEMIVNVGYCKNTHQRWLLTMYD